jgi:hypothetical protein
MKNTIILFCILSLISSICLAQSNKKTPEKVDITIKPFPILSFIPPSLTEQQLGWFKEAGFNVMTIHPNEEAYKTMKKYWDGNWILFKEFTSKGYDYKAMADFRAEDPKRIGFFLGDEPKTYQLDSLKLQYDFLRSKYPDMMSLVNIFPSFVSQSLLGSTYNQYMDDYFGKLQPAYASLDNYPCYREDYNGTTYYHDLEMMRETAQKNNCKILGFVQVYSSHTMRDVSASDLAWQVNSLLAYGSKGLFYFYFRHPVVAINELVGWELMKPNKKDSIHNFSCGRTKFPAVSDVYEFGSGVLNAQDQKGERFNDVAEVNREALTWGNLLDSFKSLYVRHILGTNEPFPPVGTDEFSVKDWGGAEEPYVTKIFSKEVSKNMGYILSYFEDPQKRPYIMIVNKRHGVNLSREAASLPTTINFTKDVEKVFSISNKTGKEEQIQLNQNNAYECVMTGGGALFLRLELKNNDK